MYKIFVYTYILITKLNIIQYSTNCLRKDIAPMATPNPLKAPSGCVFRSYDLSAI